MRRTSFVVLGILFITSAAIAFVPSTNPFNGSGSCGGNKWSCNASDNPIGTDFCYYCRGGTPVQGGGLVSVCELTGIPSVGPQSGRTACFEADVLYDGQLWGKSCNDTYGEFCSDLETVGDSGFGGFGDPEDSAMDGASYIAFIEENTYDGPEWWGTIGFKVNSQSAFSDFAVAFDVPAGVHCTNDYVPPGAKLSPLDGTGSSARTLSNHCVYSWTNATPLASGVLNTFNYSTDSQEFSAATNVSVRPMGCLPESDASFCKFHSFPGKSCGSFTTLDNCQRSRTVNCGSCQAPEICGGAGKANVCGVFTSGVLNPTADAYVREGEPTTNFGTATALLVKDQADNTTNTRRSFLKFDISGYPSVGSAKLRLYGGRGIGTTQEAAYAITNDSWTETEITWEKKPTIGLKQGSDVTIGTTIQYYEFDVTAFVQSEMNAGNHIVSLAVLPRSTTSNASDTFNSREAAINRPELVITP